MTDEGNNKRSKRAEGRDSEKTEGTKIEKQVKK